MVQVESAEQLTRLIKGNSRFWSSAITLMLPSEHPAEGEGSARSNAGIIQLIVTPIVLIHRRQVRVTNFEAGIIYYA